MKKDKPISPDGENGQCKPAEDCEVSKETGGHYYVGNSRICCEDTPAEPKKKPRYWEKPSVSPLPASYP